MKKENKLYTTGYIDTEMDLEVGQPIWHQDPHTKKWNTGTIYEELEEPYSYTIQDSARQYYRHYIHTDRTGTGLNRGKLTKQTFRQLQN